MNSRNERLVMAAALSVFTFAFTWTFTASAAPIDKVEAQVRALAATVEVLRTVATLQQKSIDELRRNNDLLTKKLKCVAGSSGDVDFVFDGCNVHVLNGVGQTGTTNGRGNLIVGYNKNEVSTRTGSHNIIVGDLHEYTSYGGIVSGTENTLSAPNATILSSVDSEARLGSGTILGADRGITDAAAVIAGGHRNYVGTTGNFGAVIGGTENTASGGASVAVGGTLNNSSGSNALVCGGSENSAVGNEATVSGGSSNASNGLDSSISGGSHNVANGRASSISGGWTNTADGDYSSILGGNTNTVSATFGTSP